LAGYFIGQSTSGVFTILGIAGLSVALIAIAIVMARSRRARPSPKPPGGTPTAEEGMPSSAA
jgi:hypothetical protein